MTSLDKYKNISLLINYKPGHIYDDRNWSWIKKRYQTLMPNSEICIGNCANNNYSKSLSINEGANKATGDLFIIADPNIAINMTCIDLGLKLLKKYPFVIPFSNFINISKHDSYKLHNLSPNLNLYESLFTAYKKESSPLGSLFMIPRVYFEKIGGFDENITEWYEEDTDFINRLCGNFGSYGRVSNCSVWNLFHEKIQYPLYQNGINVEIIHKEKDSFTNMHWDIRI
ncbi:hypothetical protein SH2C18_08530 [Clostridium sediminicola]|uniref:galactosyltransferase-related protein n=1 Tax=Clostridium sediminicola TaxID=3114879 RepID=UPI0031F24426